MAGAISHVRSVSLPSRSHPLDIAIEDQLCRLRSSSEAGTSSTNQNLSALRDLYELVNETISLPLHQQALSYEVGAEKVLEGSLSLLDICGSTKDLLFEMKSSVLELQSSLRRRNGKELNDISTYKVSRRKTTKMATKLLANLKKLEKSCVLEKDAGNTVTILKELEKVSISTLRSVLAFFSTSKHGWSIVAKLVNTKQVSYSEVSKVDHALYALDTKNLSSGVAAIRVELNTLEKVIFELEDGLESVSRALLKLESPFSMYSTD